MIADSLPEALSAPNVEMGLTVRKPWGVEVVLTPSGLVYAAKLLHVNAGERLSLQIHEAKTETLVLIAGHVLLSLEDDHGVLVTKEMVPSVGYTIHAGRRHRIAARSSAVLFEASTPEVGRTLRLEDDYGRQDETDDDRLNLRLGD